ncbi:transcriptional regulator, TetR family [Paenibacillus algorifonticola]|uniref:Transcriptional regulator, TetR family n=1 Tax=Paenibacillus algorifonticola TaxID=684063 RepID=A0A1I2B3F6_9BACL|nr:TetR/AcrR family transcriptional regulator [Paenibacillus algorifonticola]SFE50579.1 transcriptional regulator, TetR family [Paenibacillus algorifonticola]
MRLRDENKIELIFEATIQLINEIGVSETSISKIAKRANVSAATIYIYFENKEDMLGKTYLKAKKIMSDKLFNGVDHSAPIQQRFDLYIRNFIQFVLNHKQYFLFMEQISNSPLLQNWCLEETAALYLPIFELFESGKQQQLFKEVDNHMLITYSILPIAELAKEQFKGDFELTPETLNTAIKMSWDAIKR